MVPSRIRVLMVGVRNMNGSVEWACPWRSKGRALTLWAEPAGPPSAAKPTLDSSLGRTGGGGGVSQHSPRLEGLTPWCSDRVAVAMRFALSFTTPLICTFYCRMQRQSSHLPQRQKSIRL